MTLSLDPPKVSGTSVAGAPMAWVAIPASAHHSLYPVQASIAEYDPTTTTTFIVYLGGERSLYATSYNHTTTEWAEPVFIATYPSDMSVEDDHGAPSFAIDPNGYLCAIFGPHGGHPKFCKSTNPRDISAWTSRSVTEISGGTYFNLAINPANADLYLFFRSGSGHSATTYPAHEWGALAKSTNGGTTFAEIGASGIVDTRQYPYGPSDTASDCYAMQARFANGKVYLGWLVAHGSGHDGVRSDVFYAYYNPTTGHMHSLDGTDQGASLSTQGKLLACRAFTQDWTNIVRSIVNSDGTAVVVFNRLDVANNRMAVSVVRWNGSAWSAVTDTGLYHQHAYHGCDIRKSATTGLYEVYGCSSSRWVAEGATYVLNAANAPGYSNQEIQYFSKTGADISWASSSDAVSWTVRDRILLQREAKGLGWGDVQVVQKGIDDLKALAAPYGPSANVGSTVRTGNAPHWANPILAIGDTNLNLLKAIARAAPKVPVWDFVGHGEGDSGQTVLLSPVFNVDPSTTWQAVDMSPYVPLGTMMIKLRVLIIGANTGWWGVNFRMKGSTRSVDADVYGRGEDGGGGAWNAVIPLSSDRQFEYKSTSTTTIAAGGIQFRLMGWQVG